MNTYYQSSHRALSFFGLLGLRDRYVYTKARKLRLRYRATAISAVLAVLVTAGVHYKDFLAENDHVQLVSQEIASLEAGAGDENFARKEGFQLFLSENLRARISDSMRSAPSIIKKAEKIPFRSLSVGEGQTIAGVLQDAGVSGSDAFYAVKELGKHFDVRRVRSGQKIGVHFKELEDGSMDFDGLTMKISPVKQVKVTKAEADSFVASLEEEELERKVYGRIAKIETSLYGSAARADIPAPIIAEMIRIYSWNVDFQRDVRRGDEVEVLYEAFETEDGDYSKYGKILYANLSSGDREKPIYRYEMADGRVDYFGPDGQSTRKTLMRTPVDGARISSGFGMRRHPILGYNKMHKGVDFAAPTGTPIYAAGDGVVEYVGRRGAYGNYVRIRHNSKLKTAYAHMSKYRKGLRKGQAVKQGEVIAYVGSTGRSTGPHLHYEVLLNGTQVNPRSMKLPIGEVLKGKELAKFKAFIRGVDD